MSFISGYMFSSHRSPAFVFSHRRVQSGFCDHSVNWTSRRCGNRSTIVVLHSSPSQRNSEELAELRQGNRSVTDYSIEFRTLAAECKWNYEAQWDMFRHGLANRIINEIYRESILQVGSRTKAQADRHRSKPPIYLVGQKVWLSS